MNEFRNYLNHLYKPTKQYLTNEDGEQIFTPTKFVNLLFIHHVEKHSSKQLSLVADMMKKGISNLKGHQSYTTCNIADIFKCGDSYSSGNSELILIDGAPGIGKTILSKEIAYRWACNELLSDNQLVLLIFLRDPAIQNINSIKSLIHYFYKFEKEADSISAICAEYLFDVNGKNITMIFDGYDEVAQPECKNDFLLHLMYKEILPQCRIVVTSRPIASVTLHKRADLQVEILGFTEENRQNFIKSELSKHPDLLVKVTSCLEENSTLNHLCYIPFILSVLVCVVIECEELPTNQIELYEKFIVVTISHFLKKLGLLKSAILNFQDLITSEYKQYFSELCKYAFFALLNNKLVFTRNEIKREFPQLANAPGSWDGLGLLKSAKYFSVAENSDNTSYNFLHLSIQECLAAYYITTLDIKHQIGMLRKYFFVENYLNMWIMYIGLNKDLPAFKHFLSGSKFQLWTRLSTKTSISRKFLNSSIKCFYLFQCFTELKDPSMCSVFGSLFQLRILDLSYCVMSLKEIDTLLYLLDRSAITDWNELNLSHCFIRDVGCLQLCRGICKLAYQIFFQEVNLSCNLLTVDSIECIIGMLIKCKAQKLYAGNNIITKNDAKMAYFVMEYAFAANSMTFPFSIIVDDQESLVFNQTNNEKIAHFLPDKSMITGVYCINCQINDRVTKILISLISTHQKLSQLYFWNSNMDGNILQHLLSTLPQHSEDQLLFVHENIIIDEIIIVSFILSNFSDFIFIFVSESSLILHNASYTHISHMILSNPMLPDLKELCTVCISNYKQGNAVIELLKIFFSHCKVVSKLFLLNNDFTDEVLGDFVDTIKMQNSLREVLVHENNLTENDLSVIRNEFLKYDKSFNILVMSDKVLYVYNCSDEQLEYAIGRIPLLTTLVIEHCCITDNTAVMMSNLIKSCSNYIESIYILNCLTEIQKNNVLILQIISSVTTLLHLILRKNVITTEAAEVLAFIISNSTRLKGLCLDHNHFQLGAIKIIANALKGISSIKVLSMEENNLPAEVADDLAPAIKVNTLLEELWLCDNHFGSSTVIIVNALTEHQALQELYLDNNENIGVNLSNAIASVITNNNLMEKLHLSNNNLKSIGIIKIAQSLTNISRVKAVNFQSNNITDEAAEALTSIISSNTGLEKLCLGYNQLHNGIIEITNALKSISSLQVLDLADNTICHDVADNLAIVITRNRSLEYLCLSHNHFGLYMTVILKACTELSDLKQLIIGNTDISDVVADDLAAVIKTNLSLITLTLSDNDLQSSGFIVLAKELKNLKFFTYFYAHNINITSIVSDKLISIIENNPSLRKISLGSNSLEDSLLQIATSCGTLRNLQLLELSTNCVSYAKLVSLASVINTNISLVSLSLNGITLTVEENLYLNVHRMYNRTGKVTCSNIIKEQNCKHKKTEILTFKLLLVQKSRMFLLNYDIINGQYNNRCCYISCHHKDKFYQTILSGTDCDFIKQEEAKYKLSQIDSKAMISSLQIIRTLKVINLENNNIDEDAATELAGHLYCNDILEQLWLRGNELYDKGASVVLQSLHNLSTLLILDLSFNHLSNQSADGIAVVIGNNCSLQQLWLDGNDLLTRGVVRIASALKKLSSLRILSLCSNGITDDAAEEISNVITSNVLLVDLLLGNNQLEAIGVCKIAIALTRKLLNIKKLDLSNNLIIDTAEELAVTLSNCTNLQQLFLSDNMLETEGTIKIANALKYVNTLQVLTLSNNNITESAADVLVDVLKKNISLKIVLIGGNDLQATGVNLIVQTVKNITTLQLLDVSDNNVSVDAKENIKMIFANYSNVTIVV